MSKDGIRTKAVREVTKPSTLKHNATQGADLKSSLSTLHQSGKFTHWGLTLQELDQETQHHSGKQNRNAIDEN